MQTIMIVEDDPDIRDGVRIALDCNRVWVDEQEADLTETEYKTLKLLMQSPQRIFRCRASTRPCGASRISTSPTAPSWCISAICGWQSRRTAISKLFCQSDTIAVSKLFLQHPCPLRHLR